jgi:hypothetical protein
MCYAKETHGILSTYREYFALCCNYFCALDIRRYRDIKFKAVAIARELLVNLLPNGDPAKEMFKASPKKDDMADALAYALEYTKVDPWELAGRTRAPSS